MKPVLWIPCYNEGTQEFFAEEGGKMPQEGHILYQGLNGLREKIQGGIFSRIIITNDGSEDDTLDGLQRFTRENDIPDKKICVLGENGEKNNRGKLSRFLEVMQFLGKKGFADRLIMTDADLVNAGGQTFELLAQKPLGSTMPMHVSHQGEWCFTHYLIYDSTSSGTRAVHIGETTKLLRSRGIQESLFEGCGFGLEILLNQLLHHRMIQCGNDEKNIPFFLPPIRKGSGEGQVEEIKRTKLKLIELLGLDPSTETDGKLVGKIIT